MKLAKEGANETEKSVGLLLLNASVEEFSLNTCSPLNLSVAYHKKCSLEFQKKCLKRAFVDCLDLCRLSPMIGSFTLCYLTATTLNSILIWNFNQVEGKPRRKNEEFELRSEVTVMGIILEESWCDLLTDEKTFSWIVPLLTTLSSTASGVAVEESTLLSQELQQLMVTLCSVNRRTFPTTTEGKRQIERYLYLVIKELLPVLIKSTSDNERFQSDVLISLKGFDALSKNLRVGELIQTSLEITGSLTLLQSMSRLTSSLLAKGCLSSNMGGTVEQECCSLLIKIWARLCTLQIENIYKGVLDVKVNNDVKQFVYPVFEQIIIAGLSAAEEDDLLDETKSEDSFFGNEEEVLLAYATIGRCAAPASLELLCKLLKEEKEGIIHSIKTENAVSEHRLERTAFLIQLAGSVASDDVLGEDPSVPAQLSEISRAVTLVSNDPTVRLGHGILEISSLILEDSVKNHLSVRTMECCLHALTCWVEAYLLPTCKTTPNLQKCFGNNENGRSVLQRVVSICNTCLTTFSTEDTIEELVCNRIFRSLTNSEDSRKCLVQCSAWLELHMSFTSLHPVFQRLKHKMLNHISNALCLAAGGYENERERTAYLMALLNPLGREIHATVVEKKRTVSHVTVVIEIMRGIAKATREIPESQPLLFSFFEEAMESLLKMLDMFAVDESTVCSILKLSAEIVEANIVFLEETNAKKVCSWSLQMIGTFCKNHVGVKDLEVSQSLQEQKQYEQSRSIQAILALMKNLTDWELLSEFKARQVDVSMVTIEGLTQVICVMSEEMLKFPKLCFRYYDLLAHLCEVYPEKIACLQPSHLQALLSTLDSGLCLNEMRSFRIVLEALEGLAKYHWQQRKDNKAGIMYANEQVTNGFAAHYVSALFRRLIEGQEGEDAVAACSMSIWLLFHSDQRTVHGVLLSLITTAFPQHNVEKELNTVFAFCQEENPLFSNHEDIFRKSLFSFIKQIREIVRLY
eukprot:g956.t1